MTKDTDPIFAMGRELARICKAHNEIEDKWLAPRDCAREHHQHERELKILDERRETLEQVILTSKAHSAEGAMVQIMVTASYIESLEHPGPNLPREMGQRCDGALASALAALEELTGPQREEIGGTYYARRDLDCFAEDIAAA